MIRRAVLVLALVGGLTACGGSNKVGNSTLLNIKEKAAGGFDPASTTTQPGGTLPPASTTSTVPTSTRPVSTTRPPRTTTTLSPAQQKAITAVVKIEPDNTTSQFSPSSQGAYAGTPVQWTNADTKPRSVVSDDGKSFNSGPIAPGASYTWTASGAPRTINYHDGTRPYAVGSITLAAHP